MSRRGQAQLQTRRFDVLAHSSSSSSSDSEPEDVPTTPLQPSARQRKAERRAAEKAKVVDECSESSPLASCSPPPPGSSFIGRLAWWSWKVIQTLLCVITFFLGGFLCGGCCLPCGRKARPVHQPHRRRRRRWVFASASSLLSDSDAASATPQSDEHAPTGTTAPPHDFESWTEDDDDEWEYEKESDKAPVKWRHKWCGRCCTMRGIISRGITLLVLLLLVYSVFFVRVVPGTHDAFQVQFGSFDGGSFGGVPIPDSLHAPIHAFMGQGQRPGIKAREDGLRAHFPIVFVPGIVSTGLELWEGEPCAKQHFRQRLWGSALMLRSILLDSRCWLRHLSLDGWSGLDPAGIKLRPSSGLEASDYLVGGFWIWAKLIENFADVGYDVNSMFMAPYDWRLSMKHLQTRDYFFSKLKATVELAKLANHNRKVVMIAHSMGGQVAQYFLQWVESPAGGAGGPSWVADHVESFVGIGVPFLGVPKVFSALFSGEMRDTAELAPFLDYWRQRVVFSQTDVLDLMRTIRSLPSMFPKGGNVIWGDAPSAPDDKVRGEQDEPEQLPTQDYPGGHNESFVTSQATPEKRDKTKYEDEARIQETANRTSKDAVGAKGLKAEANKSNKTSTTTADKQHGTPLSHAPSSSSSSLGQFLSFSTPVPWPFPNITRVVERFFAAHTGNSSDMSARELKRQVEYAADTGREPNMNEGDDKTEHNVTVSDLNLEDAMHLLKLAAWPDIDFNEQLYSQGYGAYESMEQVNARETGERKKGLKGTGKQQGDSDTRAASQEEPSRLELLDLQSPAVQDDQRRWANPLESALPFAPHMKIYCLYGVGRRTERGYVYAKASETPDWPSVTDLFPPPDDAQRLRGQKRSKRSGHRSQRPVHDPNGASGSDGQAQSDSGEQGHTAGEEEHSNGLDNSKHAPAHIGARSPVVPLFQLNTSYHDPAASIRSGVKLSDGDGTVPLISLGYMCIDGWKQQRWNPAGMSVITREYRDLNESLAMLRSVTSVDHVDIMGNHDMIRDLLYIASIRIDKRLKRSLNPQAQNSASTAAAENETESDLRSERTLEAEAEVRASRTKADEEGDEEDAEALVELERLHASGHPVGELTWNEVSERVYSRVRPISLRVHKRWEERTGHKLQEAVPPPPRGNAWEHPTPRVARQQELLASIRGGGDEQKQTAQEGTQQATPSQPSKAPKATASPSSTDGAAEAEAPKRRLRFEWTDEDEQQLVQLLELKRQATEAKDVTIPVAEAAPPAAEKGGKETAKSQDSSEVAQESCKEPSEASQIVDSVHHSTSQLTAQLSPCERLKRAQDEQAELALEARAEAKAAQEALAVRNSERDLAGDEERLRAVEAAVSEIEHK